MPYLFRRINGNWEPEELSGPNVTLPGAAFRGCGTSWIMLCPPGKRVLCNGYRIPTGARHLRHRDLIRLEDGEEIFYSDESVATPREPLLHERERACLRCQEPLGESFILTCPTCHGGFHANEERQCWSYAATCNNQGCPQPTALDNGLHWRPPEEDEDA